MRRNEYIVHDMTKKKKPRRDRFASYDQSFTSMVTSRRVWFMRSRQDG